MIKKDIPLILTCSPEYFDLSSPDPSTGFPNDMIRDHYDLYQQSPDVFREKAKEQWQIFKNLLIHHLGAEILELSPQKNLEDLTFTADASLSLTLEDGRSVTLLSRFSHEARAEEVQIHHQFLRKYFPNTTFLFHEYPCEGSGDNVYDTYRHVFWSGYTKIPDRAHAAMGRSSEKAHSTIEKATGAKVIPIEVQRPFFHVDTTLFPLSKGHILFYSEGLALHSYEELHEQVDQNLLIPVTHEEAFSYACNGICWGQKVILPNCGERIPALLQEKGYDVKTVDISVFIMAGGGPHCLVNLLNLSKRKE